MRILHLDTETGPNLCYTYRLRKAFIGPDQIVHGCFFLCYQYAWNDDPVKVESLRHKKHMLTDKDDRHLVISLAKLVSQADVVVAHNAVRFDLGLLSARLAAHNLQPFSPPQVVDTLMACRHHFRFESNSLDSVCRTLKLGRKFHSGGFETTLACMNGDQKAWGKLLTYGKQDVELLRKLYYRILPWITNHPDLSPQDPFPHCPRCNGTHLEGRGYRHNKTQTFKRYQCHKCHGWTQVLIKGSKSIMRKV